jgi:CO/xanthine dehydrogenase Mo-binding subunit
MSIMGTHVLRVEDEQLITSGGEYVEDLHAAALAGAGHGMFVRSPLAHARVTGIDTSVARQAPGVLGVYTAADIDLPPASKSPFNQPWLADEVVRYVGEPVALVITEQRYQLDDAAEGVDVDYEPLAAVIGVDDALAGETLLFPDAATNVVKAAGAPYGEATFDGCEVVVSRRIHNQRVAPAPLETRGAACVAGDDGRLTVWLSTQNAQDSRDTIAKGLRLDPASVRVITPDVGGGFGAKIGCDPEAVVLGWAARHLGRGVRWTETRSESMTAMTQGRGQRQDITIGGTRDGIVRAFRLDIVQDGGAYPRLAAKALHTLTSLMSSGVYHFPVVEAGSRSVVTNATPTAAYRGAGRPEATAAVERAMDLFAAEIGMDPAEVRRANFIRPDEFPYTTPTGASYDTGEYAAALDKVLTYADYQGLRAEQARRRETGERMLLGLGLASYVEITGGDAGGESGRVDVAADGSVVAYTGSSPHGQGLATSFAMVLSDRLGVPMEKITVRHGNTDEIPSGIGTFGSRSLQLGGSALRVAADEVFEQGKRLAAELLEAAPEDVEHSPDAGGWQVRGAPSSSVVTLAQVAERGGDDGLTASLWLGDASPTFPFGTHLAVVEVDRDTGKATLSRIVACDDAGPVVNPLAFQGQRHGGLAQGTAQALLEVMRYDTDGNPMTGSFADYPIVTAPDMPDFELLGMETPTTRNPLGVKGVGEAATIGSTPAAQNAVVDAVSHLGVRHIDMPTDPMRVWEAINDAQEAQQ